MPQITGARTPCIKSVRHPVQGSGGARDAPLDPGCGARVRPVRSCPVPSGSMPVPSGPVRSGPVPVRSSAGLVRCGRGRACGRGRQVAGDGVAGWRGGSRSAAATGRARTGRVEEKAGPAVTV
ncbi:hypothetical protein SCWH03_03950 [Streptomyces pacificus]|uniref:Uncharacterized protein n=1 Tax=Streptomyces pacificus TaxID=2705029 RepID=A0A6A0ANZ2_9ACTN|nr:hypothetical protein SCWH03_03950 [Streptomyces pacificus]